jgi:hypothetical protein
MLNGNRRALGGKIDWERLERGVAIRLERSLQPLAEENPT